MCPESTHRPVFALEHHDGLGTVAEHVLSTERPQTLKKRRTRTPVRRTTAASPKTGHRALVLPQSRGLRDSWPHRSAPAQPAGGETTYCGALRAPARPPPLRDRAPRAQGAPPAWAPSTRSWPPQAQGADTGQCRGGGGGRDMEPTLRPRAPTFSRAIFFLPQPSHRQGELGAGLVVPARACGQSLARGAGASAAQGRGPSGRQQAEGGRRGPACCLSTLTFMSAGQQGALQCRQRRLRSGHWCSRCPSCRGARGLTRRALGQHERAVSFMAALAINGAGVGRAVKILAVSRPWDPCAHSRCPCSRAEIRTRVQLAKPPPSGHRGDGEGATDVQKETGPPGRQRRAAAAQATAMPRPPLAPS